MTLTFEEVLLWLFVINHGIAFGAGLYEQRMVLPQWFSRSRIYCGLTARQCVGRTRNEGSGR
jgi:hypothetical protein